MHTFTEQLSSGCDESSAGRGFSSKFDGMYELIGGSFNSNSEPGSCGVEFSSHCFIIEEEIVSTQNLVSKRGSIVGAPAFSMSNTAAAQSFSTAISTESSAFFSSLFGERPLPSLKSASRPNKDDIKSSLIFVGIK